MTLLRTYLRTMGILWFTEKRLTISLLLTAVLVGLIQLFESVLFGKLIDSLSHSDKSFRILGFWIGLSLINILASVYLAVMSDRLAHRRRLDILDQVFGRAIALPVSYHSEQGSGRVLHAIVSGTDQLFSLWLSFLREHMASLIGVIFLVPVALSLDVRMALMLFVLAVIYSVTNFFMVKRTHSLQEQVTVGHQSLYSRVGDVIGNVTVVQSYTRLMDEIRAVEKITEELLKAQYPILTWWGILAIITRVSSAVAMVCILTLGSLLVQRHELSVGAVVSFVSFSGLLIVKLEQLSNFFAQVVGRAPALQNFFHLLDQNSGALELPDAKPLVHSLGAVEYVDLTYRHKNTSVGVFNLNFKVEPGQTVALVGPSGSGKTTSLALLQRLFDPESGSIKIDGEDIRNFTLSSLRHSIATVFQDSGLFNRSIIENIRVGQPDASMAEIEQAAAQAEALEFIRSKPGGFEYVIGERGASLSGGERQRIAIARAILKNAPILIFDEATSALDNKTEKKIQIALSHLRAQQKTTFIIAHRFSTVLTADLILVFDNGRIVESGTYDTLRNQNGLFANLLKLGELTPDANIFLAPELQPIESRT